MDISRNIVNGPKSNK